MIVACVVAEHAPLDLRPLAKGQIRARRFDVPLHRRKLERAQHDLTHALHALRERHLVLVGRG